MARTQIGISLAYSPDNIVGYITFAGVTSLTPPEQTVKDIDGTNLGSTGNVEEWLPGFINSGSLESEVNHLYSQASIIDAYFQARTIIYLKITLANDHNANASTILVQGFVNKWRIHDQVTPGKTTSVRGTFGFKATGPCVWTAAV